MKRQDNEVAVISDAISIVSGAFSKVTSNSDHAVDLLYGHSFATGPNVEPSLCAGIHDHARTLIVKEDVSCETVSEAVRTFETRLSERFTLAHKSAELAMIDAGRPVDANWRLAR
jgi:hypothetical protein